jgi:hypothetical protein
MTDTYPISDDAAERRQGYSRTQWRSVIRHIPRAVQRRARTGQPADPPSTTSERREGTARSRIRARLALKIPSTGNGGVE